MKLRLISRSSYIWGRLLLFFVVFLFQVQAQPVQPILRIEGRMHTAPVRKIATDAQNRFILTASDDKTARLWSIPDGKLLQVYRPPIGEKANLDRLGACAISPDARWVAVGGSTGYGWDPKSKVSMYLFDRQTGKMERRIGGLPNTISDIAWSPDGQFLAAGFYGKSGVLVWKTDDWTLCGADVEYGGNCNGIAFSRQSLVATVADDGIARLYQIGPDGLRLLGKSDRSRTSAYSVSFLRTVCKLL